MYKLLTQLGFIFILYVCLSPLTQLQASTSENNLNINKLSVYFLPIYLLDKPIESYGTIIDTTDDQILLTPRSQIIVKSKQDDFFSHPNFYIVKRFKYHPKGEKPITLIQLQGTAEFKSKLNHNEAVLKVTKLTSDANDNSIVINSLFTLPNQPTQIITSKKIIKGKILDIIKPHLFGAPYHSVLTNVTIKDGAKPGMLLNVYDQKYPNKVNATLLLYRMNNQASIALILDSNKEIQVNDIIGNESK